MGPDKEGHTTGVDQELVDKVAKNILRSRMLDPTFFRPVYHKFENKGDFKEQYEKAIQAVWEGTDDHDAAEREKYRSDAIAALKALGYDVVIEDEILKVVLV